MSDQNLVVQHNPVYKQTCITSEKLNNNYVINFHMNPKLNRTTLSQPKQSEITNAEYLRIKGGQQKINQAEIKQQLKEKSDQKVKHWPNTLEANRKRKDNLKFEKFKTDEQERRDIDQKEQELQESNKRKAYSRTNYQIFTQKDKVKFLNSALLESNAIQERDLQCKINQVKNEADRQRELNWDRQQIQNLIEYDDKKARAHSEWLKKRDEFRVVVKEQHDEFKKKYIKQLQEDEIEGQIIKLNNEIALEEDQQKENQRRKDQVQQAKYNAEHNKKLKQMQENCKEQDVVAEVNAMKQQRNFDQRQTLLNHQFQKKLNEKNIIRNHLIQKSEIQHAEKQQKIEDILENQMQQKEVLYQEQIAIKQQKRNNSIQEIKTDLQIQRNEALQKKVLKKQDDQEYRQYIDAKTKEIHNIEKYEHQKRRDFCKYVQNIQVDQKKEKALMREQMIQDDLKDYEDKKKAKQIEDDNYDDFMDKVLNEYVAAGKNIKPILLGLQKQRKI